MGTVARLLGAFPFERLDKEERRFIQSIIWDATSALWLARQRTEILAALAALRAKVMDEQACCTRGSPRRLGQPRANFLDTFSVGNMPRYARRKDRFPSMPEQAMGRSERTTAK